MSDPRLPEVGDTAPSFSAHASDGTTVTLSGMLQRGPVVLIFYPGNNTPGWNRQLSAVRDEIESFQEQGVQPVGVNPASVDSHVRYAEKMGFPFPLLSDPDRAIAASYGALKPDLTGIQRSVIGITADGRVAYAVRGAPPVAEILGALAA